MTFAELLAEIYIKTKRPDLVDQTKSALKQATLKAHHSDFYPKDLYEVGIQWSPVSYFQSLEYRALVPRWRSFKFLRKYDSTGSTPGDFFNLLTPEQTVDEYNVNRENICYLAGEHLEIRSDTEDTYMLLGCYRHPDITEASYDSWIALDNPYLLVMEATARIFNETGNKEEAAQMREELAVQYGELKMSNIVAGGY